MPRNSGESGTGFILSQDTLKGRFSPCGAQEVANMPTMGVLMALTVLSLAGAGVVGITMAAPHATGGIQGGSSSGMMNVGYSDGMMGSGSSCPYQGNYPNCQQYMAQHNISNGDCPMTG